jgi:hypothetical protein
MASPKVKITPYDPEQDLKPEPNNYVEKIPDIRVEPSQFSGSDEEGEDAAFRRAIQLVESSGRLDPKHPLIKKGPQAGQQAVGPYAILPNTADNVAGLLKNKNNDLKADVLGADYKDPEVAQFKNMSAAEATKLLKQRPELHLDNLHDGDLKRMAYGWNQGSNDPTISEDDLARLERPGEYVDKFKKAYIQTTQPKGLGPIYDNPEELATVQQYKNEIPNSRNFKTVKDMLKQAATEDSNREPATPKFEKLTKSLKKRRRK